MLHAAVYVPPLRSIFVMGGVTSAIDRTALLWSYDIDTNQWSAVTTSTIVVRDWRLADGPTQPRPLRVLVGERSARIQPTDQSALLRTRCCGTAWASGPCRGCA